jgi:hypothetical protein
VPCFGGRGHLLLLHDTQLSACGVHSYGLEQIRPWKTPASILQMVYLPSNHLLLLAEGGHCSLHALPSEPSGTPMLLQHAVLPATSGDDALHNLQPFGCIMSSNVLSAPVGASSASLVAAAYQAGAVHLIKAAPGQGAGSMQLQAKAIPCRQALLSCTLPGMLQWQQHRKQKLVVGYGLQCCFAHQLRCAYTVGCRTIYGGANAPGLLQLVLPSTRSFSCLYELCIDAQ